MRPPHRVVAVACGEFRWSAVAYDCDPFPQRLEDSRVDAVGGVVRAGSLAERKIHDIKAGPPCHPVADSSAWSPGYRRRRSTFATMICASGPRHRRYPRRYQRRACRGNRQDASASSVIVGEGELLRRRRCLSWPAPSRAAREATFPHPGGVRGHRRRPGGSCPRPCR